MTKPIPDPITVSRIYDGSGTLHASQEKIVDSFLQFYSELYRSQAHYTPPKLYKYVDSIPFRRLMQEQQMSLDEPILVEEINMAVRAFAKHKMPGPNEFPIEWHLTHRDTLVPRLSNLYSVIF